MEFKPVKEWLHRVEEILRRIFNESNFDAPVPNVIADMLQFGTGAMTHLEDFEDVARFYSHTIGTYMVGTNSRHEVDTLVRTYDWQVKPIVERFGLDTVSRELKEAWDRGDYDKWFTVINFIEPNQEFKPRGMLAKDMPYRSVWYEPGRTEGDAGKAEQFLSVSGYHEFPGYVSRWSVTDEDVYGTDCPGMQALGDIKQLQTQERRKGQAIEKMVNPPLGGPASLKNVPITSVPGGMNIYDGGEGRQKLEPLYMVNPPLQELRQDMAAVEQRINEAFFVDLFLAISNMEGVQPRNQLDLMQRNEERLLQLGPVLEHLQGELQEPVIERTFNQAERAGILPPPPPDLQGSPLKVKYISTLAMAQKAVATQGIERLSAFAGNLAAAGWTDALMKLDPGQMIDEYARAIGVPPSITMSDEEVEQRKQIQAEAMQAEADVAMAKEQAQTNQANARAEASLAETAE
jgi:hypothetical protein